MYPLSYDFLPVPLQPMFIPSLLVMTIMSMTKQFSYHILNVVSPLLAVERSLPPPPCSTQNRVLSWQSSRGVHNRSNHGRSQKHPHGQHRGHQSPKAGESRGWSRLPVAIISSGFNSVHFDGGVQTHPQLQSRTTAEGVHTCWYPSAMVKPQVWITIVFSLVSFLWFGEVMTIMWKFIWNFLKKLCDNFLEVASKSLESANRNLWNLDF
jgi:hypothetical protein